VPKRDVEPLMNKLIPLSDREKTKPVMSLIKEVSGWIE
jgi:hypothetical protein